MQLSGARSVIAIMLAVSVLSLSLSFAERAKIGNSRKLLATSSSQEINTLKFCAQKSVLQDDLSRIQGILEKKSVIPILENALISSNGGHKLNIIATNMETSFSSELQADNVESPGSLCIPARKLYDAVRLMPDGLIYFERMDNGWAKVKAPGCTYKLPGSDADLFPSIPTPEGLRWVDVPSKHLKAIISGVEFAIAPEEDSRYFLKGGKLEVDGREVKMVATDGFRFTLASGPLSALLLEVVDVLVPQKAMVELDRLIRDYDGNVGIAKNDSTIFFRAGNRLLSSRLVAADFPEYKVIFDGNRSETFATFKANSLAQSIKRLLLVADPESSTISLEFADGILRMNPEGNSIAGDGDETLESDFNGTQALKIFVNAKYMLDFLEPVGSGEVRIEVKTSTSPLYFLGKKEHLRYEYVLAPVNVPR